MLLLSSTTYLWDLYGISIALILCIRLIAGEIY